MNNGVFAIQQPVQTFRLRRKIFKDAGTYTWSRPAGVTSCRAELRGGIGKDNACPSPVEWAGGAGAVIATNLPAQVTVVVGTNATAGGTSGGSSSFGSYATATGGSAGGSVGSFSAAPSYETEESSFTVLGDTGSNVIIEWVEPVS